MKIVDLKTYALVVPLDVPMRFSTRCVTQREFSLTQITTDEGLVGVSCIPIGDPFSVTAIIERKLKDLVIGEDPFSTERIWELLYREMYRDRQGAAIRAISAVDIALWDIKGKALELPLYKLLGGYRSKVPCYASGGYYRDGKGVDELCEEMVGYVKQGFSAVKMRIGALSLREDLARVQAVRQAIGPDVALLIDANNAYDVCTATKIGRALEELDIYLFEEPVHPDNFKGSESLAHTLDIPITSGELEYTVYSFRDLIASQAVDIIQLDSTVVGGISEFLKVAAFAKAYDVPISPHWEQEIHMHLVGGLANTLWVEYFPPEIGIRVEDKLYQSFVCAQDGFMEIPDIPGLGIEWDPEALQRYKCDF